MNRDFALLVALYFTATSASSAEVHGYQVPATYQLSICRSGCSAYDARSAFSKVVVVLSMRPLADKELHAPGKGCYYVTNVRPSDSYVQMQAAGETQWTIENGKLEFALFRSPHAAYLVELEMNEAGNEVRGVGRSTGTGVADHTMGGKDLVVGYQNGGPDATNCDPSKQVAAQLNAKKRELFIPYSPLNEAEAESLRAQLANWGIKDAKAGELINDEEHHHTYRARDIEKAFPQLRGSPKLSECSNSMMSGATSLVFLASKGNNEATLDTLACSRARKGIKCMPPRRGKYFYLDSSNQYFTLEGLTFATARTILETYASGRITGLPESVNPRVMNISMIKALFDNRYRMIFGEFLCAGCYSRFDVDLVSKDRENRLIVVGQPQGGCI
jgi:hypothetical protein